MKTNRNRCEKQLISLPTKTRKRLLSQKLSTKAKVLTDVFSITNTFNTYFNEIGINLASDMEQSSTSPETYLPNCNSQFQMQNDTVIEVHKILSSVLPKAFSQ